MAEKFEKSLQSVNNHQNDDLRKSRKSPDFQPNGNPTSGIITRERSFVRTSNQQNITKRRSLAFNVPGNQSGQLRGKPTMNIYRPPNVRNEAINTLNANAQEFIMMANTRSSPQKETKDSRSSVIFPVQSPTGLLSQQHQFLPSQNVIVNRRQAGLSLGNVPLNTIDASKGGQHRSILVTHSHPMGPVATNAVPLLNSPSSGNVLHTTSSNRVKFANEPQKIYHHKGQMNNNIIYHPQQIAAIQHYQLINADGADVDPYLNGNVLQRSKSLSSADTLTRGMAGLGLSLGNDSANIGQFPLEVQSLIDTALDDPNKLNSRCLMELTSHFIKRAIEGRRFALPIARLCINIIVMEQKETFLEALLNTCRQWYQEREKLLFLIQGMKSPSRMRFTAFMAFLTEMFCQLKRRQLQLRTQSEGAPPPLVLLTLLSKCCEDCVRPPVRSLSEIECLFYVLTCIGQDMEAQLPQQLELLMSLVRDAFLNASDSAPAIRRTLLQLIELKASHWQLPGNTVLYYYPTSK